MKIHCKEIFERVHDNHASMINKTFLIKRYSKQRFEGSEEYIHARYLKKVHPRELEKQGQRAWVLYIV